MFGHLVSAALPALRLLDPEWAHALAIRGLSWGLAPGPYEPDHPALGISVLGRQFSNPIGLAAGFDKNAAVGPALLRLGFGFVETGSVTPRPQIGNPRPRMFRLTEDLGIINRLGFNNLGLAVYLRNLAKLSNRTIPLGANLGINKEGAEPVRDYPALIRAVGMLADYAVINISSPNTPGLRDLQSEAQLRSILQAVRAVKSRLPILVKVAPDLSQDGLGSVVETCVEEGVQGLIVGNTTISRPQGLISPHATRTGRSVRTAIAASVHRDARSHFSAVPRSADPNRRGRHFHRRRCANQDPGGRLACAALHQLGVPRPVVDPETEDGTPDRLA